MDIFPAAVQRPAMIELATALDSRSAALRRDECGDWRILGKAGHVYAVPEGYLLVVDCSSARAWTAVKARLGGFAQLRQDGDCDGTFVMDRQPTATEARDIRRCLGIAKRRHVSEAHVQRFLEARERWALAA